MLETNERLKALRKALNLNQTEFGKKLGVTTTAISKLEKGERNLTDQMALAVCREYGVSEAWLRTGEGEMFDAAAKDGRTALIASLAESGGFAEPVIKLLELYASLPERHREVIDGFADRWVESLSAGSGTGQPSLEEQADAIAAEAAQIAREQFIREKTQGFPASPSGNSETA